MSKNEELEELLGSLGAVFVRHGKDEVWRIGNKIVTIGHAITQDRQFQNYRAKILRVAREEGLLAPRAGKSYAPSFAQERGTAPPSRRMPGGQHARPANSAEIAAWNIRETALWELARRGGEAMDEMGAKERRSARMEDRLPLIDKALREAGQPLTVIEICKALGWNSRGGDATAVHRAIHRYPERYRRTRGMKKNERFEFVPPTPPPTGDIGRPKPEETSRTAAEHAAADAGRIAAAAVVLERIRKMVQEFRKSPDPHRALFTIGEIAGIIGEPTTEKPPTEPAA